MAQVLLTAMVVGLVAHFVSEVACPAALVNGNGLALSFRGNYPDQPCLFVLMNMSTQ